MTGGPPRPGRTNCSRASASPTSPANAPEPFPAECAGGWTSPGPSWPGSRRWSRSPPPGLTTRPADLYALPAPAAMTTVLLTTQYLEEADRLADHIAVINHGRVIAEGTATQREQSAGTERIDVVMRDAADLTAAAGVLERAAGSGFRAEQDPRSVACLHRRPRRPPAAGPGRRQPGRACPAGGRGLAAPPHVGRRVPAAHGPRRSGRPWKLYTGPPGRQKSRRPMSAITAAALDSSVIARRNLINVLRIRKRWSPASCSQ